MSSESYRNKPTHDGHTKFMKDPDPSITERAVDWADKHRRITLLGATGLFAAPLCAALTLTGGNTQPAEEIYCYDVVTSSPDKGSGHERVIGKLNPNLTTEQVHILTYVWTKKDGLEGAVRDEVKEGGFSVSGKDTPAESSGIRGATFGEQYEYPTNCFPSVNDQSHQPIAQP